MTSSVRWPLAVGLGAWLLAIGLATATAAAAAPGPLAYSATAVIYAVGSVICHQRPERSFHVWGAQVPVCARCIGIYVGAAVAACLALSQAARRHGAWATGTPRALWALVMLGAVPTIATLGLEWTSGITPANGWRAIAGLPLGASLAWVIAVAGAPRASVEVN